MNLFVTCKKDTLGWKKITKKCQLGSELSTMAALLLLKSRVLLCSISIYMYIYIHIHIYNVHVCPVHIVHSYIYCAITQVTNTDTGTHLLCSVSECVSE